MTSSPTNWINKFSKSILKGNDSQYLSPKASPIFGGKAGNEDNWLKGPNSAGHLFSQYIPNSPREDIVTTTDADKPELVGMSTQTDPLPDMADKSTETDIKETLEMSTQTDPKKKRQCCLIM